MSAIPSLQLLSDGSMDQKLGLISHEDTYDVADLATCISFVPAGAPLGMAILRRHWKQRKDGGYDLTLGYEGHTSAGVDGQDFSLDAADQLDPIELHDQILDLIAKYNGQVKDDGKAYFPSTRPIIPGISDSTDQKNPLFGLTEWHNPGYVWSWMFVSPTIPAFVVQRLGTVDVPQSGNGKVPPQLSDNRNWLCIRGKADWHGDIWKITLSWLLSGPGGWSEDVYRRRS